MSHAINVVAIYLYRKIVVLIFFNISDNLSAHFLWSELGDLDFLNLQKRRETVNRSQWQWPPECVTGISYHIIAKALVFTMTLLLSHFFHFICIGNTIHWLEDFIRALDHSPSPLTSFKSFPLYRSSWSYWSYWSYWPYGTSCEIVK
jgi:hypothetical protein